MWCSFTCFFVHILDSFIKNNSPHLPCIYLIFNKMQGDIETAGRYYLASVKQISKPQDFVLPYIGQFLVHLFLSFTFLWCCFITSQRTCPCSSEMNIHLEKLVLLPLLCTAIVILPSFFATLWFFPYYSQVNVILPDWTYSYLWDVIFWCFRCIEFLLADL